MTTCLRSTPRPVTCCGITNIRCQVTFKFVVGRPIAASRSLAIAFIWGRSTRIWWRWIATAATWCGISRWTTTPRVIARPRRRWWWITKSSSVSRAANMAHVGLSMRTMSRPVNACGDATPFPPRASLASKPGPVIPTKRVAARHGPPALTTPQRARCIGRSGIRHRIGTAIPAKATISTPIPCSR